MAPHDGTPRAHEELVLLRADRSAESHVVAFDRHASARVVERDLDVGRRRRGAAPFMQQSLALLLPQVVESRGQQTKLYGVEEVGLARAVPPHQGVVAAREGLYGVLLSE